MASDRPKHPSGRPIRRDPPQRHLPIWRSPGDGPYLPRLQRPQPKDAIGFHHVRPDEDDE